MKLRALLFQTLLAHLFCLLSASRIVAQESEGDSATSPIDRLGIQYIHTSAAHYFAPAGTSSMHALEPDYLFYLREQRHMWQGGDYTILDNPLYHGATFVDLETQLRPHPGFFLTAGVTAENRGISYGVANTRNSTIFLRYHLGIDTSFSISDERFGIRASVGDTKDARVDEGLLFNHADIQGGYFRLDWRKLRYQFIKVGDAFAGIGLNIDDADYHILELHDLPVLGDWRGAVRAGIFQHGMIGSTDYLYFPNSPRQNLLDSIDLSDVGYTLSGELGSVDSIFRVYAQGAFRMADNPASFMSRTAFVAGATMKGEWEDLKLEATGEYRYYGGLFNAGYRNTEVYYRDPNEEATWGNTIGPHLYQLSWFERPFSQWAVFAEYQDLKDVTGWTLYTEGKWFFYDRFLVRAMLDLNYIVPEKVDAFLYPFYDVGLGWEPFGNFSIVASVTNKGMNLDKHYPTFYLYESPVPSIAFRWNVE